MQSAQSQAEKLKAQGNEYFKKEKLGAAIDAYTEAIALAPTVPAYWTNRALCYKKKSDWENVLVDCKKALELDRSSIKAHKFMGTAFLHLQHYPEAVRSLEKVLDLGSATGLPPDSPVLVEAEQELSRARFEEWQAEALEKRAKQKRLKDHLERLLEEDFQRKLQDARAEEDVMVIDPPEAEENSDAMSDARKVEDSAHGQCSWEDYGDEKRSDSTQEKIKELKNQRREMLNTLENVFDTAEAGDIPGEIPDHLCCKITMELFRDPVVTPSGITYEKAVLLEHLARGRNFDPLTRTPLEASEVAPNLAVKEAVSAFLEKHGWAYQHVFHPEQL